MSQSAHASCSRHRCVAPHRGGTGPASRPAGPAAARPARVPRALRSDRQGASAAGEAAGAGKRSPPDLRRRAIAGERKSRICVARSAHACYHEDLARSLRPARDSRRRVRGAVPAAAALLSAVEAVRLLLPQRCGRSAKAGDDGGDRVGGGFRQHAVFFRALGLLEPHSRTIDSRATGDDFHHHRADRSRLPRSGGGARHRSASHWIARIE